VTQPQWGADEGAGLASGSEIDTNPRCFVRLQRATRKLWDEQHPQYAAWLEQRLRQLPGDPQWASTLVPAHKPQPMDSPQLQGMNMSDPLSAQS
jgi:hypothetical protein